MMGDWIEWHGGECPIKSDKTLFDVKMRSATFWTYPRQLGWQQHGGAYDVIAYRIVEDHEPKDDPALSRAEIEATIAKLQAKLDVLPVVTAMHWDGCTAGPTQSQRDTHTFEIVTINGVPHINGVAMALAIRK
jgi:hypothetical protein